MSYFAIIKAADGGPLSVRHCHANLWMLPGFPATKTLFDVGVHLRAEGKDFKKFSVALPFASEQCVDLAATLGDATTSQLIFRQQSRQGHVSFRDVSNLKVSSLDMGNSKQLPTEMRDRSLWDISLTQTLSEGDERYARFRFVIQHCARAWNSKRHVLMTYGGLLDFRIADTREVRGDSDWDSVRDRIVPIESVQFFLVTPLELQLRQSSPIVYSTRVLEPNAWEKYLRRTTLGKRMVINGWEYPPTTPAAAPPAALPPAPGAPGSGPRDVGSAPFWPPIGEEQPYRIFADFSREATSLSLPTAIQNVVLILLLGGVMWFAWQLVRPHIDPQDLLNRVAAYFLSLTVVGVVTVVATRLPMVRKIFASIGVAFDWIDGLIYQRKR